MKFVLLFASQEFEDFRQAEFSSLVKLSKVTIIDSEIDGHDWNDNFLVITLHSFDDCYKLIRRSVLIKSAYQIWAQDKTLEELCLSISKLPDFHTAEWCNNKTFRLNFESFHVKMKSDDKIHIIESVLSSHDQLKSGKIDLKNPEVELGLVLDYTYDFSKGRVVEKTPNCLYYGRFVGFSNRLEIRHKYKLSERQFIGNTSMDVKLSFIMCNLGQVCKNDLVLDPFVGTGSILIAAGHYGAKVIGSDIDYKVIHGIGKSSKAHEVWRGEDECLRKNFEQYGMKSSYLDVFVGDSSRLDKILRKTFLFDVILTDPPYGVREKSVKIMSRTSNNSANHPEHFPQKENYQMSSVFTDLLDFSSSRLKIDGYLVTWLPLVRDRYLGPESLPKHPCLNLLYNCEQILNNKTSRRLLVYQKVKAYFNPEYLKSLINGNLNSAFRNMYFCPK